MRFMIFNNSYYKFFNFINLIFIDQGWVEMLKLAKSTVGSSNSKFLLAKHLNKLVGPHNTIGKQS